MRVKIFPMPEKFLLSIFRAWHPNNLAAIEVPVLEFDLPPEVKVIKVWANWSAATLDVLVEHESFEDIEEGAEPPRVSGATLGANIVEFADYLKRRGLVIADDTP